MTENKDPGIKIELICLLNANVAMANQNGKQSFNLQLTDFERVESPDNMALDIIVSFDLMSGVEKPLFVFKCSFAARYTRQDDSLPWEKFSSAMALAHIVPYLREFVGNITNRLPVPVLLLPAFNTAKLLADLDARRAAQAPAEASKTA
jgi:hypothetical protein